MRTLVVAVGRLRPPYADDVQHYQKLLARHTRLELVEVREDQSVDGRIPERAFVVLLSAEGAAAVGAAAGERGGGAAAMAGAKLARPPRPDFGDFSSNAPMLLAPTLGEPPRTVAERPGGARTQAPPG